MTQVWLKLSCSLGWGRKTKISMVITLKIHQIYNDNDFCYFSSADIKHINIWPWQRGIDQIFSMFWAVRLATIVFPVENSLKSFKIFEHHTFLEFIPNVLTESKIRCENPIFFYLFRLKYLILCHFWIEIIVFDKKTFTTEKSKEKPNWIQTILGVE